jgi:hypothetical protein
MKLLLTLITFLLLLAASPVAAEDLFVAQTSAGAADGSSCANALAATFFNNAANWGAGAGQINGGDTVHLCGTITSTLTTQGSGTAGNLITILFESGAKLSQAVCPSSTGCLQIAGHDFIVVDGGSNGIIETTGNGTAGTKLSTKGIYCSTGDCNDVEIKNLTLRDFYVRVGGDASGGIDETLINAIRMTGSNISIHDCIFNNAGWMIVFQYADGNTNFNVYRVTITNMVHGLAIFGNGAVTAGTVNFYENSVSGYDTWANAGCTTGHGDGIHAFGTTGAKLQAINIYRNEFKGPVGTCMTAHIFLEGTGDSTPWTDATGVAKVWNNIFVADVVIQSGIVQIYEGTSHWIQNNIIIGPDGTGSGGVCLSMDNAANVKIQNNIIGGCNYLINLLDPITFANAATDLDYNGYVKCTSFNCFTWVTHSNTGSFATWKSQCSGCDTHSVTSLADYGAFSTTTGRPASCSALGTDIGLSLAATFTNDVDGNTRPANCSLGSVWDMGPVEQGAGAGAPATSYNPTSLTFASTPVGAGTPTQTITLTNVGDSSLTVTSIVASGTNAADFHVTHNCTTVAASGTCTITVYFNPAASGSRSGSVTITSNAPTSPDVETLSGTAVDRAIIGTPWPYEGYK